MEDLVEPGFLSTDELNSPWGAPSRIARGLLDCVCNVLDCSLGGLPYVEQDCSNPNDRGEGEEPEPTLCKLLMPGPGIETLCCGAVVGSVNRIYTHAGDLAPVRQYGQRYKNTGNGCDPRDTFWAMEMSIAVLRCVPEIGGWGGNPMIREGGPVGDVDPSISTDYASILMSDKMAMLLAIECCFDEQVNGSVYDDVVSEKDPVSLACGGPLWLPGTVQSMHPSHCCRASVIGFGVTDPIRIHLPDGVVPCASDCLALGIGTDA